jgi:uncharacterized protein (DUF58 family)
VCALLSEAFAPLVFAWNFLLLIGFAVDALLVAKSEHVTAERNASEHLTHHVEDRVVIKLKSDRAAHAIVIDEPPVFLLSPDIVEVPLKTRLIRGGTSIVEYVIRPRKRGRGEFGVINVLADGPLRLARRRITLTPLGTTAIHSYPRVGDFDKTALDPELMMAELGIKRVRRRAEGTEFESLRDAVLEDEIRRIDWRASARRGKLTARNYELEKNHEVVLCIDTGRLMGAQDGDESKLDRAITAAIRLAAVALRSGDRVGVISFGSSIGTFLRPDKGRSQLGKVIEAVHDLEVEAADSSYFRALSEVRARQKKRALIVFLTDFVDREASREILDVLSILVRKHAVLFVALRDPHIRAVADAPIADLPAAYRSIAAMSLEESRAEVIENLSAQGVRALDLVPDAVSQGAISAYLALRSAERL